MSLKVKEIKLPGDLSEDQKIQEMIRVNHAGEYGAKRIYEGQLKFARDPELKDSLQHMLAQELVHLSYFEEEIRKRKVRPTALFPFWHIAGYALGAVTALIGPKATMACTEAVEEVIDKHYKKQIDDLSEIEQPLRDKLIQFRQEEIEHQSLAIKKGSSSLLYSGLKFAVSNACKIAIKLAKKI